MFNFQLIKICLTNRIRNCGIWNTFADLCLSPLRVVFYGKSYTMVKYSGGIEIHLLDTYGILKFVKYVILFSVMFVPLFIPVLLIITLPMTIVGIVCKFIALSSPYMRNNYLLLYTLITNEILDLDKEHNVVTINDYDLGIYRR